MSNDEDQMDPVVSTEAQPPPDGATSNPAPPRAGLLTPARIATTARVVFIVFASLAFAYFARAMVLPVVLASFAAMTLKAPVRWLHQCRFPTPLAAAIVVSFFVAGICFGVVHLGRPAVEWIASAPDSFPRIKAKFQHVLRPAARLSEAAESVGNLTTPDPGKKLQPVEVKDNHVAKDVFTRTGSLLAGAGETVALLFLLLASGDLFLHKLVRAMPKLRDKKQAVEISREIQQSISTYLFSVTLINVCFGVAVGFALYLLGMPNALMWGGVAAFANFVPIIGPVLGMTAVGLAGLLAFDTLGYGILPVTAYCLLHLIETYAVTPYVLGRRFALNPVFIFIGLIFFAWLWGVIGALLAFPLLMTVKVVCDHVQRLSFLSELLGPHEVVESAPEEKNSVQSQPVEPAPVSSLPPIP
jgi:predicted PurR-regulated permease PerM